MGEKAVENAMDFDWGPEGSITQFIAERHQMIIKRMRKDGWDPEEAPEKQQTWWTGQKEDKEQKAAVILTALYLQRWRSLDAHVQQTKAKGCQAKAAESPAADNNTEAEVDWGSLGEEAVEYGERSPLYEGAGVTPTVPHPDFPEVAPRTIQTGKTDGKVKDDEGVFRQDEDGKDVETEEVIEKLTPVPFSPGKRQVLLKELPRLEARNDDLEFGTKLRELQEFHSMHPEDTHALVKAKCPGDIWGGLPHNYQSGGWALTERGTTSKEIEAKHQDFKEVIQQGLGPEETVWGHKIPISQKKGESVVDYAERKWEAYVQYGGQENPQCDDEIFLKMLKEGFGPEHQKVLKMGLPVEGNYTDIMQWATVLDQQQGSKIEVRVAAGTQKRCYTCGRRGHMAKNCKVPKNGQTNNRCMNCRKPGHRRKDCWAPGGGKEGQRPRQTSRGGSRQQFLPAEADPDLRPQHADWGMRCQIVTGVWAQHEYDCGRVNMIPVRVPGPEPSPRKQYPINWEVPEAVCKIIEKLERWGIVRRTQSTMASPIRPVRNPDESYRLTIDYTALNKVTPKEPLRVASRTTILNGLGPDHTIFSVLAVVNGFWAIPLHDESQDKFAFTVDCLQYTWTRLPQGFHNSPTILHRVMCDTLSQADVGEDSTVVHYGGTILIASKTDERHARTLLGVLRLLKVAGFKVCPKQAQLGQQEVQYLGYRVAQGERALPQSTKEAISRMPSPVDVRGVRRVLGRFNSCRIFIENFAKIAAPIQDLTKGGKASQDSIEWDVEQEQAYTALKQALLRAPALALTCMGKPFHLYAHNKDGFYSAILTQEQGDRMRPVGYFSTKQPPVVSGMLRCVAALDCASWAVTACKSMVMTGEIFLHTRHTFVELLNTGKLRTVSECKLKAWKAILLPADKSVVIDHDNRGNPAEGILQEGEEHSCLHAIEEEIPGTLKEDERGSGLDPVCGRVP
ncbi:uncharacterized protein [Heterodontus francisci]|uniref:uncharacterized protein n=1 Tax=Heterodontus francisci TaxID=7792 RepID=UPI00355C4E9F